MFKTLDFYRISDIPTNENIKQKMKSRIEKPISAQNYEMELEDILEAQVKKIPKDDEWMKDWSTDYQGYRPIGEPNIPIRFAATSAKNAKNYSMPLLPKALRHRK